MFCPTVRQPWLTVSFSPVLFSEESIKKFISSQLSTFPAIYYLVDESVSASILAAGASGEGTFWFHPFSFWNFGLLWHFSHFPPRFSCRCFFISISRNLNEGEVSTRPVQLLSASNPTADKVVVRKIYDRVYLPHISLITFLLQT